MHVRVRKASLSNKKYNCIQTIFFSIVLLLILVFECINIYNYMSYFFSRNTDKIIVVLYDLKKSELSMNVIRREWLMDCEYGVWNVAISSLSSLIVIYFAISGLLICWRCQIDSFLHASRKLFVCIYIYLGLFVILISADLFFIIQQLFKIVFAIVLLIIMFVIIDDYFMMFFRENVLSNSPLMQ